MNNHQLNQIKVINKIEKQVNKNTLNFSTVSPVEDYLNDPRICLTSAHFIKENLISEIHKITDVLKKIKPDCYYYPDNSLHTTIKNIRSIKNPPNFNQTDIIKVKNIFSKVIPDHNKYNIYFYKLLLFPNSLSLIGTTDIEYDNLILDLDRELKKGNIADDRIYNNSKYFFSNITLARFAKDSDDFKQKVLDLSQSIQITPYSADNVTLLSCNAVLKKRNVINSWKLK